MTLSDILQGLREIEGAYGSFLVNNDGVVVERDYPNIVSNRAISVAGKKLSRLWDSLKDRKINYINLNFKHHKIHIRKFEHGSLFIFIPPRVNLLTLEGIAKLAVQSLDEMPVETFQQFAPDTHMRNPDRRTVILRGIAHDIM